MTNLPFAEAMALDPSDVEVCRCPENNPGEWFNLGNNQWISLDQLLRRHFRRALPRRSRVQEMAERGMALEPGKSDVETIMTEAIRAVCEYLREPECQVPGVGLAISHDIEREFLERRPKS